MSKIAIFVIVAVFSSFTIAFPQPAEQPQQHEIVFYESDGHDNGYNFQFETSDGTARVEKGELKPDSSGGQSLVVEGAYAYTDDQGKEHRVLYIADDKGYRLRE